LQPELKSWERKNNEMGILFTILIVIVSLALGAFVLIQNPKGGGLAAGFTGGAQIGGVQRTTDFLEKGTWYLMVALFALCILSASVYSSGSAEAPINPDPIETPNGDVGE